LRELGEHVFEEFSRAAFRMISLSQEEARLLNHNYIGTEHFLLSLVRTDGVAAKALESFGVSHEKVRLLIAKRVGVGQSPPSGHLPFTSEAKDVLLYSLHESLQLNHDYIGTGHLLLALIGQREELGAKLLNELEADAERLRLEVFRLFYRGHRDPEPALTPSVKAQVEAIAFEARAEGFITRGDLLKKFDIMELGFDQLMLVFERLRQFGVDVVDRRPDE
jgi:ATP-dependent Clp protease ATP-binding subunit ClpC